MRNTTVGVGSEDEFSSSTTAAVEQPERKVCMYASRNREKQKNQRNEFIKT